jgi:hypothetical protein
LQIWKIDCNPWIGKVDWTKYCQQVPVYSILCNNDILQSLPIQTGGFLKSQGRSSVICTMINWNILCFYLLLGIVYCSKKPCVNQGVCQDLITGYKCFCPSDNLILKHILIWRIQQCDHTYINIFQYCRYGKLIATLG